MRISDWSSDVCSSDLAENRACGDVSASPGLSIISLGYPHGFSGKPIGGLGLVVSWLVRQNGGAGCQLNKRVPAKPAHHGDAGREDRVRSEEHTSELQSLMRISYAVFCLKKKKRKHTNNYADDATYEVSVFALNTA